MPKLLVVYQADDRMGESLARAAAQGARGVRFMEVDERVMGAAPDGAGGLVSARSALEYDGIVIASSDSGVPSMEAFVRDMGAGDATASTENLVFAVVGDGAATLVALCVGVGGIIAGVRGTGDAAADAEATGARAAKVAGWVRHGLGHEAEHQHDLAHRHSHHH